MYKETHNLDGTVYHRVNKTIARKVSEVFALPVLLQAMNMSFTSGWQSPFHLTRDLADEADRVSIDLDLESFDSRVRGYEMYNCCSERGYKAKYYISKEALTLFDKRNEDSNLFRHRLRRYSRDLLISEHSHSTKMVNNGPYADRFTDPIIRDWAMRKELIHHEMEKRNRDYQGETI